METYDLALQYIVHSLQVSKERLTISFFCLSGFQENTALLASHSAENTGMLATGALSDRNGNGQPGL